MIPKILIIGASGQIGTELTQTLRAIHGVNQVIASDLNSPNNSPSIEGPFEILDATDADAIINCVKKHQVNTVYLLAAMLSATAEKVPQKAWHLNMTSLLSVLEMAKVGLISKIFWPSSIAVFGPSSSKINTPQSGPMDPSTVYGISKLAGEHWCAYYQEKYGVDVRSIRYPGLISWKAQPGGGTTDYAVAIFHDALKTRVYNCFLEANTMLPMMHMTDAIRATMELMTANLDHVEKFKAYNIAGMSFTPSELADAIKLYIPEFKISYAPDFRQHIADSWPNTIDDSEAAFDWNWKSQIDLDRLVSDMLTNLK